MAIKGFSLVVLPVCNEMVALFNSGLELKVYFLYRERHGIRNIAPPSHLLEVVLVSDSSCMELEKGPVDLRTVYPQRCFWREWDLA
jgi:hypothetical protein